LVSGAGGGVVHGAGEASEGAGKAVDGGETADNGADGVSEVELAAVDGLGGAGRSVGHGVYYRVESVGYGLDLAFDAVDAVGYTGRVAGDAGDGVEDVADDGEALDGVDEGANDGDAVDDVVALVDGDLEAGDVSLHVESVSDAVGHAANNREVEVTLAVDLGVDVGDVSVDAKALGNVVEEFDVTAVDLGVQAGDLSIDIEALGDAVDVQSLGGAVKDGEVDVTAVDLGIDAGDVGINVHVLEKAIDVDITSDDGEVLGDAVSLDASSACDAVDGVGKAADCAANNGKVAETEVIDDGKTVGEALGVEALGETISLDTSSASHAVNSVGEAADSTANNGEITLGEAANKGEVLGGKVLGQTVGGKTVGEVLSGKTAGKTLSGKSVSQTVGGKTVGKTAQVELAASIANNTSLGNITNDTVDRPGKTVDNLQVASYIANEGNITLSEDTSEALEVDLVTRSSSIAVASSVAIAVVVSSRVSNTVALSVAVAIALNQVAGSSSGTCDGTDDAVQTELGSRSRKDGCAEREHGVCKGVTHFGGLCEVGVD